MAKKKKASKASSKPVSGRKGKKIIKSRKKSPKPPKRKPTIREITVRYGGVIRTGSYENRRVSYEMTADCPRGLNPAKVLKYLEVIVLNQFYEAQLQALEGLPADMRDELGDLRDLSPQEATQRIGDFFSNWHPKMTSEQCEQEIEDLQKELKDIAPKIKKEDGRLKKLKNITVEELQLRSELVARRKEIKQKLKVLRKGEKNAS